MNNEKEAIKQLRSELAKVNEKLQLTSAGKFEHPTPSLETEGKRESQLSKFGL
ncbi:MAG: hypothetical protein LUF04_04300 [Bacteroides sp.]|nr:hypothetical protein [Bacteroides sp.]